MAVCDIEYDGERFSLSYTIKNRNKHKTILFLHGWGSNKEVMQQAFGGYIPEFRHIYLDMPGFGHSPNDTTVFTTKDYANMVQIFLDEIKAKPEVIAGHSFGGKVATLLNPKCLVLISSAGILVPKSIKTKAKIVTYKLLKPLGVHKFRKLFVSADAKDMNKVMYETFKNVVDEDFEYYFKNFTNKALLFWGIDDTATPLWTGEKINELIPDSTLFELVGGHFFFIEDAKFISERISNECKDLNG